MQLICYLITVFAFCFLVGCGDSSKNPDSSEPPVNSNPNNPYSAGTTAAECGEQDLMYNWLEDKCFEDVNLVTWPCEDAKIRENSDLEFSSGAVEAYEKKLSDGFSPKYCGESTTEIRIALEKPGERYETYIGATLPKKIDRIERVKALGYGGTWKTESCSEISSNKLEATFNGLSINENETYLKWPGCTETKWTVKRTGTYTFVSTTGSRTIIKINWQSYKVQKNPDNTSLSLTSRCSKVAFTAEETEFAETAGCFKDNPDLTIKQAAEHRQIFLVDGSYYTSEPQSLTGAAVPGTIELNEWTKIPEYTAEPESSYLKYAKAE